MKKTYLVAVSLVAPLLLQGCANLTTQSRQFTAHNSAAMTVDATQRSIFSVKKTYKNGAEWTAFCAEPSPDALIAFAAAGSGGASVAGKAIDLSLSQQQAVASIGLRTQTIQLLRDGMYRLCESYASGAIDDEDMVLLQRRYQHLMLGLLAIEQVTGPVTAQQVALGGQSAASIGKSLAEIAKVLAEAAGEQSKAGASVAGATTKEAAAKKEFDAAEKLNADKPTDETKTTLSDKKKALADASKALGVAKINKDASDTVYASLEKSLEGAQRMATSVASNAQVIPQSVGDRGTTDFAIAASTVLSIVEAVLKNSHLDEVCGSLFGDSPIKDKKKEKLDFLASYCVGKTDLSAEQKQTLIGTMVKKNATRLQNTPSKPPTAPASPTPAPTPPATAS